MESASDDEGEVRRVSQVGNRSEAAGVGLGRGGAR